MKLHLPAVSILMAAFLFAAPLQAQVHVPGTYATLQAAIDAVVPGTVIVVHGGTHLSIVINKPLTIIGKSSPLISAVSKTTPGVLDPSIMLAGTGSGVVTLIGLRTSGSLQEGYIGHARPGILGSGFDQLRILQCNIAGSGAISGGGTEALYGSHAIEVTIPYVLIEDSIVTGGSTVHTFVGIPAPSGSTGILAPASTVTLLDSQVIGGRVHDNAWNPFYGPCPMNCGEIQGGAGGAGLVAAEMYQANSSVAGGQGASFYCPPIGPICMKPDGVALTVPMVTNLSNDLTGSGLLELGFPFDMSWTSLGNPTLVRPGT